MDNFCCQPGCWESILVLRVKVEVEEYKLIRLKIGNKFSQAGIYSFIVFCGLKILNFLSLSLSASAFA
jgi:hypothetical protein